MYNAINWISRSNPKNNNIKKIANAVEAATGLLMFCSLGLMAAHIRPKIVLLLLLLLLLTQNFIFQKKITDGPT